MLQSMLLMTLMLAPPCGECARASETAAEAAPAKKKPTPAAVADVLAIERESLAAYEAIFAAYRPIPPIPMLIRQEKEHDNAMTAMAETMDLDTSKPAANVTAPPTREGAYALALQMERDTIASYDAALAVCTNDEHREVLERLKGESEHHLQMIANHAPDEADRDDAGPRRGMGMGPRDGRGPAGNDDRGMGPRDGRGEGRGPGMRMGPRDGRGREDAMDDRPMRGRRDDERDDDRGPGMGRGRGPGMQDRDDGDRPMMRRGPGPRDGRGPGMGPPDDAPRGMGRGFGPGNDDRGPRIGRRNASNDVCPECRGSGLRRDDEPRGPGMGRSPSDGDDRGPGMGRGPRDGEGRGMNRGPREDEMNDERPMLRREMGPRNGDDRGPGMGRGPRDGDGRGPGMGPRDGEGRGPGMGPRDGEGPGMGRGPRDGEPRGPGREPPPPPPHQHGDEPDA